MTPEPSTTCPHCQQEFNWIATARGIRPLNRSDGKEHWATCRGFKRENRKKNRERERIARLTFQRQRAQP